ncbi:MAG: FAD-dependent oxidoreductase, partial [Syntrophorhabdales bacterium]
MKHLTIKDIEPLVPFSRGSTEIFLTGHWSSKKPAWTESTSPCRQACPIGNDIARAFSYAGRGAIDEALHLFRQNNPLPGVCGRVCYHPCEADCNRKDLDEPVNIRAFERFLADHGDVRLEPLVDQKKERVAVVGSGPAGLSAAYHLARLGYPVTVFEAFAEPGGMLQYGIPEYRLPKDVLKAEIAHIMKLGVSIKTGVKIGTDLSLAALKEDYQAVFLALGAHAGMRLGVKGEDAPGVIEGIAFLHAVNGNEKPDLGRRVAVIGGGNTAVDCARSALRIGADVRVIYRRSRSEMPALAEDVAAIEAEGITLDLLAAPNRVITENGRVSALECLRMELGQPDESGRRRPVPVKGSEYLVAVDTVIAAVGQAPDSGFAKDLGLSLTARGIIETSPSTATNV